MVDHVQVHPAQLGIRRATWDDVATIVELLADDQLGAQRESTADLAPYWQAFQAIDADPDQLLVVAEWHGEVVGTLQLTVIPGLSHRGATRGHIEAVRIRPRDRGQRLGSALVLWAVEEARRRGCRMVQLTSHRSRAQAHGFYTRLGFEASHTGFKLVL